MISFNDYRDKDGSINWGAYRKAQIAAGEICKKCRGYINILRSKGYPELCGDCRSIGEDFGEVTHDKYVRCPNCKCQMEVCHLDNYRLYEDGDHDIFCEDCGHEFMVTTYVSYSFRSPGLRDTPRDSRGRFMAVSENS